MQNDVKKVGLHVSPSELKGTELKDLGMRVFQICSQSPRQYTTPNLSFLEGVDLEGCDLVIHSPFWVNLCKCPSEPIVKRTMGYCVDMSREMTKHNLKWFVVHIGGRGDVEPRNSVKYIINFCLQWLYLTDGQDTILCLENDSGSKNYTKMGSVKILEHVVKTVNSPRVRMCFDSEHAYANGFDLSNVERLRELAPIIEVVHFNSIPENVVRGKHLDRHSETYLRSCKEGPYYIMNVYKELYNGERPFILERNHVDFWVNDTDFIRNYGKSNV